MYHHIGSSPLRKLSDFATEEERQNYIAAYNPAGLERAIRLYPNTKFIMGHMGFDFNHEGFDFSEEVFRLARTYPNVWLELSAFGRDAYDPEGAVMDGILRRVKAEGFIPRTIYGSDGPGFPGGIAKYMAHTRASLARVGYTRDEALAILQGNSKRLFKLAP